MPAPRTLLPWLLGGAIGAGGIFQGLHWKSLASRADFSGLENQLRIAGEENALLKRENEALRSLAQGGGNLAVPPELVQRVEKELALTFQITPAVHRTSSEELRDRISASLEARFGPAGMDYRQEAYAHIGWIRPEDRLLAQLTAVRAVGARGWFDEESGEAWVIDKFDTENIPDQAALVRLLARILLHQHFLPPQEYPGDDAARAREALHQGAASGCEARFLGANARAIGFMPMKENAEAEQLLMGLSGFVQGITMFPVMEGKSYADTLYVQGPEKLLEALRNPPQSTREILRPGADPAPPLLPSPVDAEEALLEERAGELGLRLWLEPLGDVAVAASVAAAWENDTYRLFPDGDAGSAVVWDIELESEQDTELLLSTALDLVAAMAGREESAQEGEVVETLEKRFLCASRQGEDRVRFLNVVLAETAAKLK